MWNYYLTIVLAPLIAAIVAGLCGQADRPGRRALGHDHRVGLSCVLSFYVLYQMYWGGAEPRTSASTPGMSRTACAWRSASWSIA